MNADRDRLCPNPEQPCEDCIADFIAEHPGAELFKHTFHSCDCLWIADTGEADICVGCGELRDAGADWLRRRKEGVA